MDHYTVKVALVTGAGQACGRVLAEDFAARGARVVVNHIDAGTGAETAERIRPAGGEARFMQADVGAFLGADVPNGMFQRFLEMTGASPDAVLGAIPIRRMLAPRELCAAVRYLDSDDARFVCGTTLVLDGGFTSV